MAVNAKVKVIVWWRRCVRRRRKSNVTCRRRRRCSNAGQLDRFTFITSSLPFIIVRDQLKCYYFFFLFYVKMGSSLHRIEANCMKNHHYSAFRVTEKVTVFVPCMPWKEKSINFCLQQIDGQRQLTIPTNPNRKFVWTWAITQYNTSRKWSRTHLILLSVGIKWRIPRTIELQMKIEKTMSDGVDYRKDNLLRSWPSDK